MTTPATLAAVATGWPAANPGSSKPEHPDSPGLIWVPNDHFENPSTFYPTEPPLGCPHTDSQCERPGSPIPSPDAQRLEASLKRELLTMSGKSSPTSSNSGFAEPADGAASATSSSDSDYQPKASPPPGTRLRQRATPQTAEPSEQRDSKHALAGELSATPWKRRGRAITPEFKRAILQRARETGQQNAVAREAGINERTLRRWIADERKTSRNLFPPTHERRSTRIPSRPATSRKEAAPVGSPKIEKSEPAEHKSGTSPERIR